MRIQKFADGSRTALISGSMDFARFTRLLAPSIVLSNLSSRSSFPLSFMRAAWQYFLCTSIPTYTAILIFHLHSSLVGLNAAVTYSRAMAHSLSRSRRLPIHTPDRFLVMWFSGLPTAENYLTPTKTRDFSSIHTHTKRSERTTVQITMLVPS